MSGNRIHAGSVDDLSHDELVSFVIDGLRRILVHYGFWFKETEHQLGLQKALEIENKVWSLDFMIQMKRLSKILGFEIDDSGIPLALKNKSREELVNLINAIGVNWLANDGIWFQAVEKEEGMFTAKRCNDTCWTRFSPFEAFRIKEFLGLPAEGGGLEALKQALSFRLYARINVQSFEEPDENTLIFRMNECRVQSARKRKGLEDYPCKSAGLVEYTTFATSIDPRIKTECIGCPPDEHPEEWYCSWKFSI